MGEGTEPVFVVGSPRSGTSILTWCVGQHSNILPIPETNWIGKLALDLEPIYETGAARGPRSHLTGMGITDSTFYEAFGDAVSNLVVRHSPTTGALSNTAFKRRRSELEPKRRWVDGTPENSFYIVGLLRLFPRAKFIHLVRDVTSVVRSLGHFKEVGGPSFTEHVAYHYWLRAVRACLDAERAFGSATVTRVLYDDLVAAPEETLRRCLDFLGEAYEPQSVEPLQTTINSSKVPPDFDPHDASTDPALRDEADRLWDEIQRDKDATYAPDQERVARLAAAFAERTRSVTRLERERSQLHAALAEARRTLSEATDAAPGSTTSAASGVRLTVHPNPVPADGDGATVMWETGDGAVGQVYVTKDGGPEVLLATAPEGSSAVTWITAGATYEFRLYAGTERATLLSAVTVRPREAVVGTDADEFPGSALVDRGLEDLVPLMTKVLPRYAEPGPYQKYFRLWEGHGVHLTPVHFYFPIPDTRTLPDDLWERESSLVGINMNDAGQLQLLREAFPVFRAEYDQFPREPTERSHEFYFNNGQFSGTDALALYCMIRHFQPKQVIEVGSGFSSRIAAQAAVRNTETKLVCIEPNADEPVRHDIFQGDFPGLTSFIPEKVEDVDVGLFEDLNAGDILFIDTSHVVRIGGEVNHLYLEVLPRLKPGVLVHVHDIFFPGEYPKHGIKDRLLFYSEQYLLHAFLLFNADFEVLFCNSYLGRKYQADMRTTFPNSPWWGGGSFWMRRRTSSESNGASPADDADV